MPVPFFNLDIEPTNRCNAHCYFCPRDQTPHQGLMTAEVFDQTLGRIVEFRDLADAQFGTRVKVNLCGLGEPLLNRRTPEFVRQIRDAGFDCSISTNGSLLDEARANALLDAGLQAAEINVGEVDEDYEQIYGLPFDKTAENVVRFAEMAGDRCEVRIVLVNHRRDGKHMAKMVDYWKSRGIDQFLPFSVMNRGGSLFVDEMQYANHPERAEVLALLDARGVRPACPVPFIFLFVGYDGQYYLCCSDWKKEVPLGSVYDTSFAAVAAAKLEHVSSGEPICKTCNHDPINQLTDALRASDGCGSSTIGQLVDEAVATDTAVRDLTSRLETLVPQYKRQAPRRIPLTVRPANSEG